MKKIVNVTIEVDIEIEIKDTELTPESLVAFSKFMFPVASPDDLFRYVASTVAANEYCEHVEGIGSASSSKSGIDSIIKHSVFGHHVMADVDNEVEVG